MPDTDPYDPLSFFSRGDITFEKHRFEHRPQQEKMAKAVRDVFQNSEILIAEAGTGTGKTLAYLIPALHHAKTNKTKVVVSTETRNLQSQILESDVPAAARILRTEISACTAFGSANYLCPRRLEKETEAGSVDIFMAEHLEAFLNWCDKDPEKILFYYGGFLSSEFRTKICRDKDDCPGRKCRLFDECPYYLARENWKKADLLLVNHSLLAAHTASGNQLLPDFSFLIVDEAHRFPEIYEQSSRPELSLKSLNGLLRQMALDFTKSKYRLRDFTENDIRPALASFEKSFLNEYSLLPGKTLRLRTGLKNKDLETLNAGIKKAVQILEPLAAAEEKNNDQDSEPADEEKQKYIFYYNKLKEVYRIITRLQKAPEEQSVHWVILNEREARPDPVFTIGRIRAGAEIKKLILDSMEAAVFTSATLTASGKEPFEYYLKELTAEAERGIRMKLLKLESPFDYGKNCLLYLPAGMPDPSVQEKQFHAKAAEVTAWLDSVSGGGMFVLFTSIRSLREIHSELIRLRPEIGDRIISQVSLGAKKALDEFRNRENPVLLGLASFWQGIDIPGDHLRQVVLVRIPFRPPDDPVTEALTEFEKKQGAVPFFTVQLPRAVIQIKQGFGRLIRTGSDRGAVTILDPRMESKAYGKEILKSLPPAKQIKTGQDFSREYRKIMQVVRNDR